MWLGRIRRRYRRIGSRYRCWSHLTTPLGHLPTRINEQYRRIRERYSRIDQRYSRIGCGNRPMRNGNGRTGCGNDQLKCGNSRVGPWSMTASHVRGESLRRSTHFATPPSGFCNPSVSVRSVQSRFQSLGRSRRLWHRRHARPLQIETAIGRMGRTPTDQENNFFGSWRAQPRTPRQTRVL